MLDELFKAKIELSSLNIQLKAIDKLRYEINAKLYGTPLTFHEEFKIDEEGFDFRYHSYNIQENFIRIDYKVKEGNEIVDCIEYISIEQFVKYAK